MQVSPVISQEPFVVTEGRCRREGLGCPPAGPEMQGPCAGPEDRPEGAEEGNRASVPNCKGRLWQKLGCTLGP